MSKIIIVGGDLPRGSEFYNNPGSIGGFAVAAVAISDPEAVAKLGVSKPFGIVPRIYFLATLSDGRRVLAATDQRTYNRLQRDIAEGPLSPETVAQRKKEVTRLGVIFIITYFIALYGAVRYLTGYLPFMIAFAVGAAVCLAVNYLFTKMRR